MAPVASKPKPTFVSSKNNNYKFLCAANAANLSTVRKGLGLTVQEKYGNGNVALVCSKGSRNCRYRAMFVAESNAIYEMSGRVHSHPVKVPAATNATTQNDQPEHNQSAHEDKEPPTIKEEAMEEEEGGDENEQNNWLLVDVHNAQHLAQLCRQHTLKETGRTFECAQPNCPFRASFLSEQSKLCVISRHNH